MAKKKVAKKAPSARTRQESTREGRAARVPFGAHRLKLQLSEADLKAFDKAGYVTRWFNDQDGRVERAQSGGYEFVKPEEALSLGQGAIHQDNSDLGNRVSKVVSRGDPIIRSYLMKIKKEWYTEDQESKEEINRRVDETIAAGEAGGVEVENKYGDGVTYSR